jgi:hypothetical protein
MVTSQMARKCLGGEIVGEYIVDAHCHMGPWHNFLVRRGGWAEAMVEAMDLCGIAVSIVAPHLAIGANDSEGNDQAYRAAERFPERIVPYVTPNPNYGADHVRAEIARWHPVGIRAFKLHPACHQYAVGGLNYRPVFEYAAERGLPVLSHSWEGDAVGGPTLLAALAGEYPSARFVIGHSASTWGMIGQACEEVARHPNVYLDLCGSGMLYGALEHMVATAGADRILFGSDDPFLDPRPPLGRVLMARIGDDDKRLILGQNARELFRL